MNKEKEFTVSDTDLENPSIIDSLKGWEVEGGEPVGEMKVLVTANMSKEDNSFSYPGFGGGTHRQIDVVAEIESVHLVNSKGEVSDDNILELIKESALDKMRQHFEETTSEDDI